MVYEDVGSTATEEQIKDIDKVAESVERAGTYYSYSKEFLYENI